MTRDDIERQVLEALTAVAPEIDPSALRAGVPLRDQVELDSMDFLRFMVELQARVGVSVPEADYGQLISLQAISQYVEGHRTGTP